MKTSELQGAALDWAVAKALGGHEAAGSFLDGVVPHPDYFKFYPSTDWAHGGPIIEREEIYLLVADNKSWWAEVRRMDDGRKAHHTSYQKCILQNGPTPLIAAMRCYVASKLGDDIELPKELK